MRENHKNLKTVFENTTASSKMIIKTTSTDLSKLF